MATLARAHNWARGIVAVVVIALLAIMALSSCFATAGEVEAIAAAQQQVETQVAATAQAVHEMQTVLSDPNATADARAGAVGHVGDALLQLTEDMKRVSEEAKVAADLARQRGEVAGQVLGLPEEGVMGIVGLLSAAASVWTTNKMRDKKRVKRGERVAV